MMRSVDDRAAAMALFGDVHQSAKSAPTMVEYSDPRSGAAFAIGAGRDVTVLTVQASPAPPYFISRGRIKPARVPVWFLYAGENTPYPGSSAVPLNLGLKALEIILTSGERSPDLEWERL